MIQNRLPMMQRAFIALSLTTLATVAASCANKPSQQVWTTKNQSMMGVKSDMPPLSGVDPSVAAGTAVSATQLREPAVAVLLQAAESPNALLRANAIEALQGAPEQLEPVVLRALGDENRAVRFVAAMTAGKMKMQNIAPLLEPMLHDESSSVRAAAMYGLRRCGRTIDLNPLAGMLMSDDMEVKGNAAYVLGELGEKSAIILLRNAAGRGLDRAAHSRRKIVELQMAEAMVKLGSNRDLHVIRAALFAPADEAEISALACQMCGELKDYAALADLTNLVHRTGSSERPAEVRMAAALAVARIDPQRELVEFPAGYVSSNRPELRAQAAHTLGVMGAGGKASLVALGHLSRLISDPNPLVQVAAAGAVLQMQPHAVP